MKDTRKDLRIRLPESSREAFNTAKAKAERELGYTLRDNEFATRVLVNALKPNVVTTVSNNVSAAAHITKEEIAAIAESVMEGRK